VPGYAITNVRAHYDLTKRLQLAAEIENLFDHHYYTAGQLAHTGLTAQGAVTTRPFAPYTIGSNAGSYPTQSVVFYAPGAPLRAWVELRMRF
jgi:outer membrane receptor protein involved in Fe transport